MSEEENTQDAAQGNEGAAPEPQVGGNPEVGGADAAPTTEETNEPPAAEGKSEAGAEEEKSEGEKPAE